ncbi:MAG: AAA family ATPase [Planctomycetota bacterium]|nr:AAA family ATPase [Planctomycetota bacterium]
MKIAISGKGGVGKTTFSAMLAAALAGRGRGVIAIDADPDANLAAALGITPQQEPTPIAEMRDLIAERTGSESDYGGYFKLNPRVDDIPEKYSRRVGGIRLLVLGGVSRGGGGCICPASALVKALLTHLIIGRREAVIMDMEAGIEHLGRATAQSMDALIIVVNEDPWSIRTALRVRTLGGEIGVKNIFAVANRVDSDDAANRIGEALGDVKLLGRLPYDERVLSGIVRADGGELQPTDVLKNFLPALEGILAALESTIRAVDEKS